MIDMTGKHYRSNKVPFLIDKLSKEYKKRPIKIENDNTDELPEHKSVE